MRYFYLINTATGEVLDQAESDDEISVVAEWYELLSEIVQMIEG